MSKMILRQALILTSQRTYAQEMRLGLLSLGDKKTRVDVELDSLRAMQLVPQQYELILLDTMLDAMDGLQLLMLMKQQAPATKFIIVSDATDEISRAHAYQSGADFFIHRPHAPAALQSALDSISRLLKPTVDSQVLKKQDKEVPVARIADIVQTHCLSGDSVLLLVLSKHQSGDIFIYRGEVFHAQYPGKSGEGAFYDMCQWDFGLVQVKVAQLNHAPPQTIEIPYIQLLAKAQNPGPLTPDMRLRTGELRLVSGEMPAGTQVPDVMLEAPPLENDEEMSAADATADPGVFPSETPLPPVNAHWKINLMGELVEGSQVAEQDRCAFITYFVYRKMADVAVALQLDYFNHLTLFGPHLQQVMVADNLGVRHAVFDTAWTSEDKRNQYVKWCCEQSF